MNEIRPKAAKSSLLQNHIPRQHKVGHSTPKPSDNQIFANDVWVSDDWKILLQTLGYSVQEN